MHQLRQSLRRFESTKTLLLSAFGILLHGFHLLDEDMPISGTCNDDLLGFVHKLLPTEPQGMLLRPKTT